MAELTGEQPDVFEIVAIPPRERKGLATIFFVAWLLALFSGDGAGWDGGGGKQTRVVVRHRGKEHLLFSESSFDLARAKCERIALEYEAMDPHEWCQRYRVPATFFSAE